MKVLVVVISRGGSVIGFQAQNIGIVIQELL